MSELDVAIVAILVSWGAMIWPLRVAIGRAEKAEHLAQHLSDCLAIADNAADKREDEHNKTLAQSISQTERVMTDLAWAQIVAANAGRELDRIRGRYVLMPTLDGVRAEVADGETLLGGAR